MSAPKKINVLIVDDHGVVRQGLKQIFSQTHDIEVTQEAETAEEAIKHVETDHFDLILLDLSLPNKSGLDVLTQIKKVNAKVPFLIFSMYPKKNHEIMALKAGASGYLTKDCSPEDLLNSIRKIVAGEKIISSSLAETLLDHQTGKGSELPLHEKLSEREFQVMCKIAYGKSVSEIADELSLSPKTVHSYRTHIFEKMNFKTNAEIIRYAIKNGLVE